MEYLVLPANISGHQWYYQWKSVVKFGVITSGFNWYISGKPVVSIGISVVYQCFPAVYHWKSAVKFGATSGIPVFSSGITNGIPVVYHWKSVVKFGVVITVIH